MSFRYRWKNGQPPTRTEAAQDAHLLDENQFSHPQDQKIAEEAARKHLGVPTITPDEHQSVLPQATPSNSLDPEPRP